MRALHFFAERARCPEARRKDFGACCRYGALAGIPLLPPAPGEMAQLLRPGPSHDHFMQHIRSYSCALGFASFNSESTVAGRKTPTEVSSGRGPPVFVLHGLAFRSVGTLYPEASRSPKYAQVYIYDPAEATTARAESFPELQRDVLDLLLRMLVHTFRQSVPVALPTHA